MTGTGDKAVLKVRGASGKVQWASSANRVKKADLTGRLFFASTLRYKAKRKKESA